MHMVIYQTLKLEWAAPTKGDDLPAEQSQVFSLPAPSAAGGGGGRGNDGLGASSGWPEKAATAGAGEGLCVVWFQVRSQPSIQP